MAVPFVDPQRQDQPLLPAYQAALRRMVDGGRYIGGREVEAFERDLASWLGCPFVVGVSSGADALLIALRALGLERASRVALPALSGVSLPQAVMHAGGEPLFVDVDPETLTMDPGRLHEALRLSRRVGAVMVDHLFGQPAAMEAILEVAGRYRLPVMEVAFHALGGERDGKRLGTLGTVGCFSFHPARNLGALGEAGALATADEDLAARLRVLADRGRSGPYRHARLGLAARMDAFQAAVLAVKLEHLAEWNERRVEACRYYRRQIVERGLAAVLRPPLEDERGRAVYNHFVCQAVRRDELREFLAGRGIETEVFYPVPLHLQECFRGLGYREGDFPAAERASGSLLALPLHPGITRGEQDSVLEAVTLFFRRKP